MATNAPSRVKKLINDVENIVPESLSGLEAAHPDLVKVWGDRAPRPDKDLREHAGEVARAVVDSREQFKFAHRTRVPLKGYSGAGFGAGSAVALSWPHSGQTPDGTTG